jgi:hypothetical protein
MFEEIDYWLTWWCWAGPVCRACPARPGGRGSSPRPAPRSHAHPPQPQLSADTHINLLLLKLQDGLHKSTRCGNNSQGTILVQILPTPWIQEHKFATFFGILIKGAVTWDWDWLNVVLCERSVQEERWFLILSGQSASFFPPKKSLVKIVVCGFIYGQIFFYLKTANSST